jgi:hypothetical protein
MALTFTQRRAYQDTCDVWRNTQSLTGDSVTGEVADESWERIRVGVPCRFEQTQNDDDRSPDGAAGRVKRRLNIDEDNFWCEYAEDVRSGDLLVFTNLLKPVSGGNTVQVGRVMGATKGVPSQGRHTNHEQSARLFQEEKPPSEIRTAYSLVVPTP